MKIARFHVFSGTGNSLHLAKAIAGQMEAEGWGTELLRVGGNGALPELPGPPPEEVPGEGLDVFVFPVYALSVPHIMQAYIARLGRVDRGGRRSRAAVLATNGRISSRFRDGHEGQALAQAERILARRGWDIVYRETFDYPQSITSVINPQSEATREKILGLMEGRTREVAADLAAGRSRKRPAGPIAHLLGWPFGLAYNLVGRRAWAMTFAADRRCDGCGLCARECPVKAIRMIRGRPDWSYACEGCEGCINRCPRAAIQASALRFAVVIALCAGAGQAPLRAAVLAGLAPLPLVLGEIAWLVLATLLGLVALRILDLALFGLSFVPGLGSVLSFGWTAWFRRYKAPRPNGEKE